MASATIQLIDICAGGNHLTFRCTSGARTKDIVLLRDGIGDAPTDNEIDGYIRVVAWLAKTGRTNAQARTILEAGVTQTV